MRPFPQQPFRTSSVLMRLRSKNKGSRSQIHVHIVFFQQSIMILLAGPLSSKAVESGSRLVLRVMILKWVGSTQSNVEVLVLTSYLLRGTTEKSASPERNEFSKILIKKNPA